MVCRCHDARILHQPFGDRLGLQSLEGEADGGVAGDLDLEPLAAPTEIPGWFEVLFTMSQLTAAVMTGSPSTRPASETGARPRFPW